MKVTQTDTEVTIVFDKHSDEYLYGFLELVRMAGITNAEMVNFASEFNHQIKASDPKEQMAKTWDDLFINITDACIDQMVTDDLDFARLISSFYNNIGEAMGPVSYAGYALRRWFKENYPDDIKYQTWVDECIYVYEQSDFAK